MSIGNNRIRLALDTSSFSGVTDVITNSSPQFWQGTNVRFELGLFYQDAIVQDITNIESITLLVKDSNARDGHAFMSRTISSLDLTQVVSQDDWDAGTKQHAVIEFDASETILPVEGNTATYWLSISAVINQQIPYPCVSLIQVGGTGTCFIQTSFDASVFPFAKDDTITIRGASPDDFNTTIGTVVGIRWYGVV